MTILGKVFILSSFMASALLPAAAGGAGERAAKAAVVSFFNEDGDRFAFFADVSSTTRTLTFSGADAAQAFIADVVGRLGTVSSPVRVEWSRSILDLPPLGLEEKLAEVDKLLGCGREPSCWCDRTEVALWLPAELDGRGKSFDGSHATTVLSEGKPLSCSFGSFSSADTEKSVTSFESGFFLDGKPLDFAGEVPDQIMFTVQYAEGVWTVLSEVAAQQGICLIAVESDGFDVDDEESQPVPTGYFF